MQTLTLAFVAVAVLAGAAALARRSSVPGKRRDALTVVLVVLALLGAFLLCFVLGLLVRGERARTSPHAGCDEPPVLLATVARRSG